MQRTENEDGRPPSKVNYQDKNLDYIEKIKEKKLKEEQDRLNQQRKQQEKKQKLKRKVLQEASKNRDNKKDQQNSNELIQDETPKRKTMIKNKTGDRRKNFDSLPKIHTSSKQIEDGGKTNYRDRYISFLKNLHQTVKSKKEIEETQKKRKEDQYARMKEGLVGNVQSKLATMFSKTETENQQMARSQSAQKTTSLMQIAEQEMPKTNKNFKKKNQQYLQKLKQKRELEQRTKQQEIKKKERLKEKLKDFVMVTVKQNVINGTYEDDDESVQKKIKKSPDEQGEQEDQQEDTNFEEKKKKRKMRSFPYVTDLGQWKKKNRLQPDDKVFIVTGGYGDIKKALKQRGWYQNPDSHSPCFDFKYTLQGREIDYDKLVDSQLTNHFQKAGCLTTKVGLAKTLRSMKWIKDISQDNFFPKCFDLNDEDDNLAFEIHFKICKSLSILKIFASFVKQSEATPQTRKKNKRLIDDLKLRTQIAVTVCKKNIEDIDDIIDRKKVIKIITDKQWEILAQDQLNEQGLAKKKHEEWLKSIDCKFNSNSNNAKNKPQKKKKNKEKQNQNADNQNDKDNEEEQQEQSQQQNLLMEEVSALLSQYQKRFPQYRITDHNNIWILKPAGLSRGRGITCYNNLVQIQDHVKCKQSQWIAQKYIENPLVILRRKFDIRQWVLISDFNPLTIWFYEESYVRFSAVDYDPKQIKNKFIHLTNNSIGSKNKKFDESHIKGNMFFMEQFANYLQQLQGYDVFTEKIKPQFKQIVKMSMLCGVQGVQNRKNSHELFGYDFMVDQDYKVWLIEINSSPSMDFSTHVTSKLVKQCLHDIIKVTVDWSSASKKDRKNIDTGAFKKIYKGIEVPDKPITTGLNLCLEGVPLKKPKRNTVKVTNFSLDKKIN